MEDSLPFPGHCAANAARPCRFCRERIARRLERERACVAPGTHWDARLGPPGDVLGYWEHSPSASIPGTNPGRVYYLKEKRHG